jgi:hypothetical protein
MHYRANDSVAVRHPLTGHMLVPPAATEYDGDDPLVQAYPWLFNRVHTFEDASAEPGTRRAPRAPKPAAEPKPPAAKKTAAKKAAAAKAPTKK